MDIPNPVKIDKVRKISIVKIMGNLRPVNLGFNEASSASANILAVNIETAGKQGSI